MTSDKVKAKPPTTEMISQLQEINGTPRLLLRSVWSHTVGNNVI